MIRLPKNGLLYHGSYVEIKDIDLGKCQNGLDFGKGFYLTSSMEQAISFIPSSVRKAKLRKIVPNDFPVAEGRISCYKYQPNPNLFIHCFNEANEEWLHFVASNRRSDLFQELRNKYSAVDIIGGKIANDQTALTLNNYIAGTFGTPGTERADRMAIDLLKANRLKDQFCFRSEEAIASLKFMWSQNHGTYKSKHL